MVSIEVDAGRDLTTLIVEGVVTADQLIGIIQDYYKKPATRYVLWNFKGADLSAMSRDDLNRVFLVANVNVQKRSGGRTALIYPEHLGESLGRFYEIYVESQNYPVPHKTFMDRDEAFVWLFA